MNEVKTTAEAAEAAVFAARAAMADASEEVVENSDLPATVTQKPTGQKTPSEWAYERLILYLQKFEEGLDADHEVAIGLAGGDAGVIHIAGIGFFAPDIITFYGRDPSGAKTQLIQHVSQLNVMLKAAPKIDEEPNRIGFQLASALEEG